MLLLLSQPFQSFSKRAKVMILLLQQQHLILSIIVISCCLVFVSSDHSTKRSLPGYPGPLQFHLETGYVGLDEEEDVQLFYYFIRSERNPKEDPILIWLTGGPGCSSFNGLVYEIGPFQFKYVEYKGILPTLVPNPYSWTKAANIIFLDSPVGTGFSYANSSDAYHSGDKKSSYQVNQFIRKWLIEHHEFISNPIYIGGDSYSGKTVPLVVQDISDGNKAGNKPFVNIKGYVLGNPTTDPRHEDNSRVSYAHGMGLLSDELYKSLEKNCGGEYANVNTRSTECQKNLEAFAECVTGLNAANIVEDRCTIIPLKTQVTAEYRRSISESHKEFIDSAAAVPPPPFDPRPYYPKFGCRSYNLLLSNYWMQDKSVQKALKVREGIVLDWARCNASLHFNYDYEIETSVPYHASLSKRGFRSLIYSGDHDMTVNRLGTEAWIKSLNYSIVDDWRPWIIDGQIGGYTRTYANKMTFATVKGGGHTAPEYKPKECLAMFKRWISNEPL